MKTCYLDANLLLYYSNPDSLVYSRAADMISRLIAGEWKIFISPLTLDEYFHNMIRFSTVPRQEAFEDLKESFSRVIKLPRIHLINSAPELKKQNKVVNLMIKHKLRSRDAYHLFIMLENKIKVLATFDNDFERVFTSGVVKHFV